MFPVAPSINEIKKKHSNFALSNLSLETHISNHLRSLIDLERRRNQRQGSDVFSREVNIHDVVFSVALIIDSASAVSHAAFEC